jgi:VWFA-related protein
MDAARQFSLLIFSLVVVFPTVAQNENAAGADQRPTFKANVRVVLVDVVVTNTKDEPVTGLTKDQFRVFEDGKLQTVASFEEHAGIPDVPELSRMAKLPPNVFSNVPLAKAGEAANILLLDSLNTQMSDQSYVHRQMIKYIKNVRPGTRMAIFTLSDRLRFVQGFTEDPALLMAAMNGKNSAGNPELSSLLQTPAEIRAGQTLASQMQTMAAESAEAGGSAQGATQSNISGAARASAQGAADIQAAAAALSRFLTENATSQTGVRANLTLEAIDQLAMYLQAIPGRKNVIWFTGSFPLNNLMADPNMMRDYGPEVAHTANLLAAARIAIYPIGLGAVGLAPNAIYDSSVPPPAGGVTAQGAEKTMLQSQSQSLDQESTERVQSSASLEEMATNTGGEAFINTNGFNDVLDHVVKAGTYYYTLTYSPTNRDMDGQLRHIQIKLADREYKLAYRRGYYATNDFMSPGSQRPPKGDPLRPLMEHGTPDSTAILYTMKVVSAANQPGTLEPGPGPGSRRAGDNDKLKGTVTRYSVTFTVLPDRLALDSSADGQHHGNVEVTLLAYDRDGTPVNWMVRLLQVRVPLEHYQQAQANGVGFNLEMDVPASGVYLRSGLYDMGSNKAGTLEIPLGALVASAAK